MTIPGSTWDKLESEAERLKPKTLRELFEKDDARFDTLSVRLEDLLIDFSKENLDKQALEVLFELARAADIEGLRASFFSGAKINSTENRAVMHMALRDGTVDEVMVDDKNIMPEVQIERERFLVFAEAVRQGDYLTLGQERFTDVVSIGIGGSDLGPSMATKALAPWHDGPRVHFVSNVDGAHLQDTLSTLVPGQTLLIISSKTFTTQETMTNAHTARDWLAGSLGESEAGSHMAAVSTNLEATRAFGIDGSRVFGFWDWVGGRYSVWSAIGLPLAIAIGRENFMQFLSGAQEMDEHFQKAPLEQNLPVILALIGIWRRNILGYSSVALIPYDQRLSRFTAFIQQLDMESNGKQIGLDGEPVQRTTGPVIWGEAGTNAQHSFFQLIHQGTDIIPVDFMMAANPSSIDDSTRWLRKHHDLLLANALAQSNALAFGRSEDEVKQEMRQSGVDEDEINRLAPHRTFPGNRPSTTISYRRLDALTLGRLIALYEHKVFVQGAIWGINSFDQWGVELGKAVASSIAASVSDPGIKGDFDGSTTGLLRHLHALRTGKG
jgi:glucose-6-phosphate isomerase